MFWLGIAIITTLGVSFVASLLEAIVLSTTVAEIEALKKSMPRRGRLLESLKQEINQTISAILTLNTVSNALGSVVIGAICGISRLADRAATLRGRLAMAAALAAEHEARGAAHSLLQFREEIWCGGAFDDVAVAGDDFARLHAADVAFLQFRCPDVFLGAGLLR